MLRTKPFVIGFLVWTFIGLLFVAQVHLNVAYMNKVEFPLPKSLAWEMTGWYLWALLSIVVAWLTFRFPIERPRLAGNLAIHLAACVCFAAIHLLAHYQFLVWFDGLFGWTGEEALADDFLLPLSTRYTWRMLVYIVIVMVFSIQNTQRKLREEEHRADRLEIQLAQAQLSALKMQLHPHFLFNTLQSISELMHEDLRAADQMIERLGEFLRMTLQSPGSQEVSLKEELRFLRCYLEIEEVRFKDRLETIVDVPPDAMEACVPNLILQPLVENAIRHGMAPQAGHGRVEVRAARANGMLHLRVRDTGKGLGQENVDYFSKGVGLSNTRARLEQLYGNNYRLDIANAIGGGLQVDLEIPFIRADSKI